MAYKINNKRGQVAIWIVVALAIVALILILLVINMKPKLIMSFDSTNPEAFISSCIRQSVYDADDLILEHGGFINPKNTISYYNKSVVYLCKNIGNYKSCINQHPALLSEVKKEIKDYIYSDVENCFKQLKTELEKNNFIVNIENNSEFSVELTPGEVQIDIFRKISYEYKGTAKTYNNFKIEVDDSVYDLMNIANEIVNQEANYCYFEYSGYMLLYPRFKISKDVLGDSTKIYSIEDTKTKRQTQFAVRGCAIPPGI